MNIDVGWLWAAGAILAYAAFTFRFNSRLRARQRDKASDRPSLDRAAFVQRLSNRGLESRIGEAVHVELSAYLASGIDLYPDDSLRELLEIDSEELEFICDRLLKRLSIPPPASDAMQIIPPDSPVELGVMLEEWGRREVVL